MNSDDQRQSSGGNETTRSNAQRGTAFKKRDMEIQRQVMPLRHLVQTESVKTPQEKKDGGNEKNTKEEDEMERQKMQLLVSSFTEDQLNRYEMYRRSAFPKAAVKKLMQSITGGISVPPNVVIAMAGIAKVFVGEIVEEACDVAEKCKDPVPIQPKHIREAYRLLKNKRMVPKTKYKRRLLRK